MFHSDEESLLPHNEAPAKSKWAKFWMGLEFSKNFTKTLLSTALSNATLMTYLLDLEPWKFGVGLIAAEVSCPLALLFALGEAYSHFQQSKSFVASEDHDHSQADSDEEINLSDVPLTKKQIAGALLHFCSDVLEDAVAPLAISQLLASEASLPTLQKHLNSRTVKTLIATGSLLVSALGNRRELSNTLTASRKNNLQEMREERHQTVNRSTI